MNTTTAPRMGDIGTEQEETEILPLTEPAKVPDTVPAEPVPA